MLDIVTHILVLAFSRMVMQQISLSELVIDPRVPAEHAFFTCARRVVEITFIVVLLSCMLTRIIPILGLGSVSSLAKDAGRGGTGSFVDTQFAGTLVNRQLNSLIVNMQRTFADTVVSIVQVCP